MVPLTYCTQKLPFIDLGSLARCSAIFSVRFMKSFFHSFMKLGTKKYENPSGNWNNFDPGFSHDLTSSLAILLI